MKSITSDQEHVGKCGLFPSSLRDKCNVLLEFLSPYFLKEPFATTEIQLFTISLVILSIMMVLCTFEYTF